MGRRIRDGAPYPRRSEVEDAALIQRTCRQGETVQSMMDCLIAAITLRERRPLLALDRDFEVISRHVGLDLVDAVSGGSSPST